MESHLWSSIHEQGRWQKPPQQNTRESHLNLSSVAQQHHLGASGWIAIYNDVGQILLQLILGAFQEMVSNTGKILRKKWMFVTHERNYQLLQCSIVIFPLSNGKFWTRTPATPQHLASAFPPAKARWTWQTWSLDEATAVNGENLRIWLTNKWGYTKPSKAGIIWFIYIYMCTFLFTYLFICIFIWFCVCFLSIHLYL